MTNEEKIKRIMAWQGAGFVHPLTCIVSQHGNLEPGLMVTKDNAEVVLRCPKCGYVQEKIPEIVLKIRPETIEQEKRRLEKKGFKF